jgi:hypothetical protein
MATKMFRDVDEKMWKRFKQRAKAEGRKEKWVALRLFALYADGVIKVASVGETQGESK